MSQGAVMALGVLELLGLVGLFALVRRAARRRADGMERPPRSVRIATALFALLVVVAFPAWMIAWIVNPTMQTQRVHDELVQTGTPATATITDVRETGTVINRRPEVQVRVAVRPQDGPPFDSQSTWVFSVNDVQIYRVGAKVNVFFDPKKPGGSPSSLRLQRVRDSYDRRGNTPLSNAVVGYRGDGATIEALLVGGADPDLGNRAGLSARKLANMISHTDVRRFFR